MSGEARKTITIYAAESLTAATYYSDPIYLVNFNHDITVLLILASAGAGTANITYMISDEADGTYIEGGGVTAADGLLFAADFIKTNGPGGDGKAVFKIPTITWGNYMKLKVVIGTATSTVTLKAFIS